MKYVLNFFLNILTYIGLGIYYCYVGIVILWDKITKKR
jgi:hypothetical protein